LEKIKEERSKHEARIIEAEGMLEKLSRGAKESRADLDWLISVLTPRQASSSDIRKIERDTYGRDEIWWRQKLFEVRGKLEDAVRNYEKSYEEYCKNIEKLGPSRFGGLSLTQYQMTSLRLNSLNDQMTKYQDQIAEVKEILEKLVKEAKETKADPAWLE
jgi:chromosome segregation ATPase